MARVLHTKHTRRKGEREKSEGARGGVGGGGKGGWGMCVCVCVRERECGMEREEEGARRGSRVSPPPQATIPAPPLAIMLCCLQYSEPR
jgi:hypothetical protein